MQERPRITARALALFLAILVGGQTLHGVRTGALSPNTDTLPGLLELAPLLRDLLNLSLAGTLACFAALRAGGKRRRHITKLLLLVHAAAATTALLLDLKAMVHGTRTFSGPPWSLLILAALLVLTFAQRETTRATRVQVARLLLTTALIGLLYPVLLILTRGATRDLAKADLGVVFGSRVYADGSCSLSVGDRVRMAARLL